MKYDHIFQYKFVKKSICINKEKHQLKKNNNKIVWFIQMSLIIKIAEQSMGFSTFHVIQNCNIWLFVNRKQFNLLIVLVSWISCIYQLNS